MVRKAIRAALAAIVLSAPSLPSAATPSQIEQGIEHARLLGTLQLQGELFHVQGVDLDAAHIWVTSVDKEHKRGYLHEFDRATGRFIARLDLTDVTRYHPGGFSISGGSIWVPVSEYRAHSTAVLEEIDIQTLQVRRKIRVADHLGCAAVSGDHLVAGNWDSKQLYIFDLRGSAPVRVVPNPTGTSYQDMKFIGGQLVAGGTLGWSSGSIDWIDFPSMRLAQSLRTGATGRMSLFGKARPWSGEGMAMQGRDLYLLPEDGPSRLFKFELDPVVALSGRKIGPQIAMAAR
jgi:hypothetical protein